MTGHIKSSQSPKLTSGRNRRLYFGKHPVDLRHAPRWQLAVPNRKAGVVIRALAFTGTRVPVYTLFENLESGATVKEFLEWYPEVGDWQVAAVLKKETEYFRTPA